MTLFNIVSRQLKETNNIQLNKFDYDVIYVNQNVSESDLNKAGNGAITLNTNINKIFPILKNNEYVMKVPVKFIGENLEYIGFSKEELEADNKFCMLLSIVNNASNEIEIGGKPYSDSIMLELTKHIQLSDMLVVLKLKNKLVYEAYLIKSKDKIREFTTELENLQQEEYVEATITLFNSEKDVNYSNDELENNKELFSQWYYANRESRASNETKRKYIRVIERFTKVVNVKAEVVIDFWDNPIQFTNKYSIDELLSIAKNIKNSAFNRADGKGGSELSAVLKKYYEWAGSLKAVKKDRFNLILEDKARQSIYFGAPGTGKSYQLKKDSELFSQQNVERVTFHPNMSYGQFIGAFKPFPYRDSRSNESKITYKFVPGVLMKLLLKALSSSNEAFLLIIEEINRANVSAVFGDFFQLLDRDENNNSEYPITISEDILYFLEEEIYRKPSEYDIENIKNSIKKGLLLPNNLFIWSTMNSSDQGVLPMDTAFKRRWEQLYFGVNQAYVDNEEEFKSYCKINCGDVKVEWNSIRKFINAKLINENVPEDKLMGPYFISKNILTSTDEKLTNSFKNKVIMYLFEDAGKPCRKKLFNVVPEKMVYSEVLRLFEEVGLEAFIGSEEIIPNSNLETKENL